MNLARFVIPYLAYNKHAFMDREIPKEERLKAAYRKYGKAGVVTAVIAVAIVVAVSVMQSSVERSNLQIGVADVGTIETSVSGTGRVVPAFEQIINSPISSRIVEVYCKEGDTLETGTPLLRLDLESTENDIRRMADERRSKVLESEQVRLNNRTYLSDLEMQVSVKEMDVNRMQAEVINERRLDSIGSGTGERVRQAEFAYETGRLQLEQLRKQLENERSVRAATLKMKELELDIFDKNYSEMQRTLEDARLKSPRHATLTYINDQIGQQVGQGEKLAVISDLSHFKVTVELADGYAHRVAVGSRVMVRNGRMEIGGRVTSVAPLSKNGVITLSVALDEDDHPRLRPGLKTEVHIFCDIHEEALRIPSGSYFKGAGDYELFVVDRDRLVRRRIRLGDSNYEYVEVLSGLDKGDSVVVTDMQSYSNNSVLKLK